MKSWAYVDDRSLKSAPTALPASYVDATNLDLLSDPVALSAADLLRQQNEVGHAMDVTNDFDF